MTFFHRALRYLQRQKSKSIILFSCFLVISTLILISAMILQATEISSNAIRAKTGTKIVLNDPRGQNSISSETVSLFFGIPSVTKINRAASGTVYPANFAPVTKKDSIDPLNLAVTIHASDSTEHDGLFAQEKYRLLEGNHIAENQEGIIVNSILAESNGLGIGDEVMLKTEDGKLAAGKIIGIFFSGMERRQEDNVMAVHRIENQIYVDHGVFEALFGNTGYSSISVYTNDPDSLEKLRAEAERFAKDSITVTTSDALYRQMVSPLKQVTRVTGLMLALTMTTAIIVVSLLLCMWMRTRAKEMAVFISIGLSKGGLILQVITESLTLFSLSVLGAALLCKAFASQLMHRLFSSGDFVSIADTNLQPIHLLMLLVLGSVMVLTAVGISALPILRANPRDTLAKMEG